MKTKYDFSKGIKGKFFVSKDKLQIPIYLDTRNISYYENIAVLQKKNVDDIINTILKKEIEIQNELKTK